MNEGETEEVADCYGEIAVNNIKLGFIDKALDMLQITLKRKRKIHGDNHLNLGSTYGNIGEIYKGKGNLE